MTQTWAVSDIHGHLRELMAALEGAGLVDENGDWSGSESHLWILGDYVDRGPDGLGVIEAVMRLQSQATADGGAVGALLGNHEMLLLGMHRYGDTPIPGSPGQSFAGSWLWNGGSPQDQERIEERHLDWLTDLPVVARAGDDLLVHSDTTDYLLWGDDVDQVNAAVRADLELPDLATWWECWARLTSRYAFRRRGGDAAVRRLLAAFGGSRIVHGHSIVGSLLDRATAPDDQPLRYADGRVLAIDGGIYDGGPCLLVRLG